MSRTRPGHLSSRRWSDLAILAGIATLGIVVSLLMFHYVKAMEEHERHEFLSAEVQNYQQLIEERIQSYQYELSALHRFYMGSEYVGADEFEYFVEPFLETNPGLSRVEWLPQEALTASGNAPAGYSLGTGRYSLLKYAGRPRLQTLFSRQQDSEAVSLLYPSGPGEMNDVVLIRAIHREGGQSGLLALMFNPYSLFANPDGELLRAGIQVEVYGLYGEGDAASLILTEHRGGKGTRTSDYHEDWTQSLPLSIADTQWQLVYRPLESHVSSLAAPSAWGVLALGIGMALLAVLYIHSMQRRSALVNNLVNKRTAELESAQNREQAVLQTMVDGVLTIDEYGILQSLNPAAEGLFGYSADELVGKNISVLMPEPYRSAHDAYLQKYKHSGEAHIIGIGREVAGLRRNGEVFPLYLAVSELDVDGERFYTGVVRDMTPIKQAEQGLLKAKAEAEAASAAKTEFLARMTHELRTPLNAILGFGQLMQMEQEKLSDSQRECLEQQMQGGENLLHLVDEVLAIAQLEEGDLGFTFSTVPATDALETTKLSLQDVAAEHQVEFGDVPVCDACVRTDRLRLQQVMTQLVSNAIKFNKRGGHVDFDIQRLGDGRVQFSVTDSGIGIEEQDREKVFEPFIRVALNFENIDGGGVGLTMARKLVEAMGGEIGFESEYGKGSRFWINLPEAVCE